MDILSMTEIERIYSPGIGRHWFDADTKRWFRCRLASYGYRASDGKIYFVSSEQNHSVSGHSYPRLYSVRCLSGEKGSISTIGEFQQYASGATADRWARKFASGNAMPTMKAA